MEEVILTQKGYDELKQRLHKDDANTAKICEQLYDLAKLAHGSLSPERMTKFIARSSEIMMIMTGEE